MQHVEFNDVGTPHQTTWLTITDPHRSDMALVWQPVIQTDVPPLFPTQPPTLESNFTGMCIRARMEQWGAPVVMHNVASLMVEHAGRIHGASVTESPSVLNALQFVYGHAKQRRWKHMASSIRYGSAHGAWVKEIETKVRYACEVAKWSKVLVRRAKQVMPDDPEGVEQMESFVSTVLIESSCNEWVEEVVVRAAMYMESAYPRANWQNVLDELNGTKESNRLWINWPARPLLITCLMVASKMADDVCMWNNDWSKLIHQDLRTFNIGERRLMNDGLEWNLHVTSDVYAVFKKSLVETDANDCVVQ